MSYFSIKQVYNDQKGVECYTLQVDSYSVTISTLGASIIDIFVPDKNGKISNIVLGYKDIEDYRYGDSYFGATIGRYADRISNASFTLKGKRYQLDSNDSQGNSLHGGRCGFSNQIWKVIRINQKPNLSIQLGLRSPDGDMGYPGNLDILVTYTLSPSGSLTILYETISDGYCPVSLTNHTYFNLSYKNHILDHNIRFKSSQYLDVDESLNYSGKIASVENSPLDFQEMTMIGDALKFQNGFDHAFIIDDTSSFPRLCAQVSEPSSGRTLDLYSTYPVILFYTGNHLDGSVKGRDVKSRTKFGGFCLEAEQYPDSMNHQNFPSAVQKPMIWYKHSIKYLFGVY